MCCARCGAAYSGETEEAGVRGAEGLHPAEVGLDLDKYPPFGGTGFDDWQLDQAVRSLQARVDPLRSPQPRHTGSTASRAPHWRLDAAHRTPRPPHAPKRRIAERAPARSPTFTNSALLMGLVACVGGVALLGWSVLESRGELWNVGVSATVAGGVVFLLGLVLQLERIWHNSRFAVHKLRQIDGHLQDLERTCASLGTTHGTASQAFYSHFADHAHPHLLLADLKGQIDLLAMQMAKR
jgi:hypothetical protein